MVIDIKALRVSLCLRITLTVFDLVNSFVPFCVMMGVCAGGGGGELCNREMKDVGYLLLLVDP